MIGHGEKLSRNKERAIAALLSNPSIPDAASAVGIGEGTLWRWLKIPEFNNAYSEARRELVRHAVVTVQFAMSEAVETLRTIMKNNDAPASSRVSAAKALINISIKSVEIEDFDRRLSELEKVIIKKKP